MSEPTTPYDTQTWHHVLEHQQSETPPEHLRDHDHLRGNGDEGHHGPGGQSLMDFSTSAHSSNATLTSGLEAAGGGGGRNHGGSTCSSMDTTTHNSQYDPYIDDYRPYQIPEPVDEGSTSEHPGGRGYDSMFRPVVDSNHSTLMSYESIHSERMMSPATMGHHSHKQQLGRPRDGYQDVSL